MESNLNLQGGSAMCVRQVSAMIQHVGGAFASDDKLTDNGILRLAMTGLGPEHHGSSSTNSSVTGLIRPGLSLPRDPS